MTDDAGQIACEEVPPIAAEAGLGALAGVERGRLLAHIEDCAACRALVAEMAEVGDALLELLPELAPPVGFETRVLARVDETRQIDASRRAPKRLPRWPLAAAALAGAAAVGIAALVEGTLGAGGGFQVEHPGALAALGGHRLSAAALRSGAHQVGQVFAYEGEPSWVFMTVQTGIPSGQVRCELSLSDGQMVTVGTFTLDTVGYGSWGVPLTVDPRSVRGVRLVGPHDHVLAAASF